MDDARTRFLDLEQQATDLTMELERLREETLNYSNATKGLDEATTRLETTTAALLELIGKSQEIIETLGRIGTPELLASNLEVKNELNELRKEASKRLEQIEQYERRSLFSKLFGGG